MPPVTWGSRGRVIPNADFDTSRGRGRCRGHGRGQARQEMLDNEIPHVEEQEESQAKILQQILDRLDGIDARNNVPGGGENAQNLRIPYANQAIVENPIIKAQLKDLSKLKGPI